VGDLEQAARHARRARSSAFAQLACAVGTFAVALLVR
jgi:hypothetical protein